jgi:hypothetical protein
MSRNPSDQSRTSGAYETEGDSGNQQRAPRFVSDEDIVGRTDRLNRSMRHRSGEQQSNEPKFVSDEDIVRRAA